MSAIRAKINRKFSSFRNFQGVIKQPVMAILLYIREKGPCSVRRF